MSKKKRYRGHFCWSCLRILPNERFSGSGHRRHLCRKCARLGADELEYRQALRDLDRLLQGPEFIPRKKRPHVEKFIQHRNERVKLYVAEYLATDARSRALSKLMDDEFGVPFENIEACDLSAVEDDPAFEKSPIDERLFEGLEETRVDASFIEERPIDESVIEEWPIDESVVEEDLMDFDS